MATFNDLAIELQEIIWHLVLPYRGMHWVEIEGLPHAAAYVRDSVRITRGYHFGDNLPETGRELLNLEQVEEEHARRRHKTENLDNSGRFFRSLVPTVPSIWGKAGPGEDQDMDDFAKEVAYTRRCRQLSTYTQVTTLLSTCRLSRLVAQKYIRDHHYISWFVFRSMGALSRPRPMETWEAQYRDNNEPAPGPTLSKLVPQIHGPLDLVVFRLHDSQGRATPMLRQGPWQFTAERNASENTFAWFDRVAIEWHPLWATPAGRKDFRPGNVEAIMALMSSRAHGSTHLYWLVDGIPRPDWTRDYPAIVPAVFNKCIARWKYRNFRNQTNLNENITTRFLADCDLSQEFEANGRRYYIVFVVLRWNDDRLQEIKDAGLTMDEPFPGGKEMWPESLQAPAQLAYNMLTHKEFYSLMTFTQMSFILSWEPL